MGLGTNRISEDNSRLEQNLEIVGKSSTKGKCVILQVALYIRIVDQICPEEILFSLESLVSIVVHCAGEGC